MAPVVASQPAPPHKLCHFPILSGSGLPRPMTPESPAPTPSPPDRKVPRARDLPPWSGSEGRAH
eukprot:11923629-Alexandrium_andersonii.AAC.1